MDIVIHLITWLNAVSNAVGSFLLAPVRFFPGWLSNTLISAVTGVVLLFVFKYTSNQRAIGRVRDGIKADMLAIKLFKDSVHVILTSQIGIFSGAMRLLFYSVRPLVVMTFPVILLLAQMGLWYQVRPLAPGEAAVVAAKLNHAFGGWPEIEIDSLSGVEVINGPVRIHRSGEVLWTLRAKTAGRHVITFAVNNNRSVGKDLIVSDGFERVSVKRPGWDLADILLHPAEAPLPRGSIIKSVSIDYPQRVSITSGADWWIAYFFVCSMIFALIFKPILKVRI